MENTNTDNNETSTPTAEELKNKKLEELGITEERLMELQQIMLDATDKLKKEDEELSIVSLIKITAPMVSNAREGMFIGLIFGQSIAAMNNPIMGLLAMLAGKRR